MNSPSVSTLYVTTRQAAALANVAPAILYASWHRSGAFRGVTPTKAENGRLTWPAARMAAIAGAADAGGVRPDGLDWWLSIVEREAPGLPLGQAQALGVSLLGHEGVPGWFATERAMAPEALKTDLNLLAFAVQATVGRLDQAEVMLTDGGRGWERTDRALWDLAWIVASALRLRLPELEQKYGSARPWESYSEGAAAGAAAVAGVEA